MVHQGLNQHVAWLVVGVLLLWGITLVGWSREVRAGESAESSMRTAPFFLTVDEGMLSLRARDASLKAVIEEIGRGLNIETVVQISPETRVTIAFHRLSLAQAIKELRKHASIAYLEKGTGEEGRRMTKILAFPKRAGEASLAGAPQAADRKADEPPAGPERGANDAATGTESQRPGAFKFEFDPSQVIQPGR
jgi:hypothetical protein